MHKKRFFFVRYSTKKKQLGQILTFVLLKDMAQNLYTIKKMTDIKLKKRLDLNIDITK